MSAMVHPNVLACFTDLPWSSYWGGRTCIFFRLFDLRQSCLVGRSVCIAMASDDETLPSNRHEKGQVYCREQVLLYVCNPFWVADQRSS